MGHWGPRAGHTHGRAPGCASARGARAGHTRLRRRQWPSRDTHSRPPNRSCERHCSAAGPPPRPLPVFPPIPRLARLTRRHHTHTTRSAAVGAPPHGSGQRGAAASPRSGHGPSWPGGRSPVGTGPWTSQTPPTAPRPAPQVACSSPDPLTPFPLPAHAHGAGVWQVSWLGAERTQVPGVGSQLSSGFQDALAAPQVVTGISIKISTQPRHATVELRGQLHQDPGAWAEGAA